MAYADEASEAGETRKAGESPDPVDAFIDSDVFIDGDDDGDAATEGTEDDLPAFLTGDELGGGVLDGASRP